MSKEDLSPISRGNIERARMVAQRSGMEFFLKEGSQFLNTRTSIGVQYSRAESEVERNDLLSSTTANLDLDSQGNITHITQFSSWQTPGYSIRTYAMFDRKGTELKAEWARGMELQVPWPIERENGLLMFGWHYDTYEVRDIEGYLSFDNTALNHITDLIRQRSALPVEYGIEKVITMLNKDRIPVHLSSGKTHEVSADTFYKMTGIRLVINLVEDGTAVQMKAVLGTADGSKRFIVLGSSGWKGNVLDTMVDGGCVFPASVTETRKGGKRLDL